MTHSSETSAIGATLLQSGLINFQWTRLEETQGGAALLCSAEVGTGHVHLEWIVLVRLYLGETSWVYLLDMHYLGTGHAQFRVSLELRFNFIFKMCSRGVKKKAHVNERVEGRTNLPHPEY